MSRISKTFFGALAVVSLGAVQLAFGQDLADRWQAVTETTGTVSAATDSPSIINRSSKTDRADAMAAPVAPSRTIVLRLDSLTDTSVLVRIPVARESVKDTNKPADKDARGAPVPSVQKAGDRKLAVACEPPVSVLTEIAKLMQPGRCVT